jgi:CRP/FNR family transcriptional regulator, cyclic AMP receptor protein
MITTADLKQQKLLADLDDGERELIARRLTRETYAKGARIFGEGERTQGIFLVKAGKVEISKTTPDGWKQTLAVVAAPCFFGELSVIEDRETRATSAVALDNAELYRLRTEDFRELERIESLMMYKIMKTIARTASRNVHMMNEKLMKALISY